MNKNYIKIAFRNLLRNKSYAALNITGLAVGLSCCLIIGIYIQNELSYDKFHENYDRLYRITEKIDNDGAVDTYASTYSALATSLKQQFPSIPSVTRVYPNSGLIIGPENKRYQEDGIMIADSSFFEMFSFHLNSGNPAEVLNRPYTIVLTEQTAQKFFGDKNPVGQILRFEDMRNGFDFEITGIAEDPPSNSHIQFDYVVSFESLRTMRPWEYNVKYYPPMYTYVQLNSPEQARQIEPQLNAFNQAYYGEAETFNAGFELQPLSEIYLHSNLQNELSANFDITYIYLFFGIGGFILIIACINFMNLATARSTKRAREVGMRKTLGALKKQLIGQFLGEAIIMAALSMGLALILVELLLPYLNNITGKELSLALFASWETMLVLSAIILGVGALSGSYPAFYLSSFKPIQSLKGDKAMEGSGAASFRKGLVVFQFCISTILIFSTIIITRQLHFVQNENLGFDKDQVMLIHMRETANQINANTLKEEVLRIPGVLSASGVSGVPGIEDGIHGFTVKPEDNRADSVVMQTLTVDHDYLKTLGLELVAGRDFSEAFSTDEDKAFIINETAAKRFGWSENPIGNELTLNFYTSGLVRKTGSVIGVVKDFQYNSLHSAIDPVLIQVFKNTFYHDYLAVKLSTDDIQAITGQMQEKWTAFNPDRPFEYFFLDVAFDNMYRTEVRLSKIFNSFAALAIFIACLGLLGLASYSTEIRVKEIGIRKVLGAKVTDIITLLSKEFTLLIVISQIIALPLAYIATRQWLNNFAAQAPITFGLFLASALLVLAIAWLTMSYQSIKAALMNPVDSLRSE